MQELQKCNFTKLIEVGPGGGALTKFLITIPGIDFKAVELDEEKVNYLQFTYPEIKDKIIHKSFLDMERPFNTKFTVVGNFPYNISTQILFKILEWEEDVECVIGMFQKEVAQRIAASEGNKVYGVTSVLIQASYEVEYLFDVNENSFVPPPKVKSGVIRLLPRKTKLAVKDRDSFFKLVKTAFGQRRKTLRNACKPLFDEQFLQEPVFNRRAEQLSVTDFGRLSFHMK